MGQMEDELNEYQSRYNALRHDITFLKSEYDFTKREHEREIAELEMKHSYEVDCYTREKEEIIQNFSSNAERESEKVKNLVRENAHLAHRVKSLEQTIEEKDAQAENRTDASDHISRFQAKHLTELNGKIKILEATNTSLKSQIENLEDEIKKSNYFNGTQNEKFLQVEKENLSLKNKIEQIRHEESLTQSNQKVDSMIAYNNVVKERDALKVENEDISTKLEAANHVIEKQKTALAQKEREVTRRVQSAKDSDWMKLAHLQDKNAELEAKVSDYENFKSELISRENDSKLRLQEQIGAMERQKMEIEKQLSIVQSQLEMKENVEKELEREKNEHANSRKKLTTAQNELLSTQNIESEMMTDLQRLRSTNDSLKQQNQLLKQELDTLAQRTNAERSHHESQWAQEKLRLTERNQYLEDQVEKLNVKLKKAAQIHLQKKRNFAEKLARIQQKSDSLEAKEMELTIEKQNLDDSVPLASYNEIKQRLNKVEKRYRDLSEVKSNANHNHERPNLRVESAVQREAPKFTEAEHLSEVASLKNATFIEKGEIDGIEKSYSDDTICSKVDKLYMQELESLKDRLNRLSDVQKEQMKYFLGTEEATDLGKILDYQNDLILPREGAPQSRSMLNSGFNNPTQFEISDLEMTLS